METNASWKEKLQKHHHLIMMIGCVLPIVFALAAAFLWGFNRSYVVWVFLLLCPLVHYFLMKEFHKEPSPGQGKKASGGTGKCH